MDLLSCSVIAVVIILLLFTDSTQTVQYAFGRKIARFPEYFSRVLALCIEYIILVLFTQFNKLKRFYKSQMAYL